MKSRCYTLSSSGYYKYGARGITVCEKWKHSFINFYNWAMSNGYQDNLTIDRKNNNGNYFPENCQWTSNFEQSRNKRNNRIIIYNGISMCLQDWSNYTGLTPMSIDMRLKRGWTIKQALTETFKTQIKKRKGNKPIKNIEYNGKLYGLIELSRMFNINRSTLKQRINKGNPIEIALLAPLSIKHQTRKKDQYAII
jgi:hypothetical protein